MTNNLEEARGIRLDIGCGANKVGPDWVGMDMQEMPGVDIVHDLTVFPWPIESESVLVAFASHLVEHIPPFASDGRFARLVRILAKYDILHANDLAEIGELDTGPLFIRFMNEVWRVLKPHAEFAMVLPHGWSPGYLQDPTHINACNENTWIYFDPEHSSGFWRFYRPMPWMIRSVDSHQEANIHVVLRKRPESVAYWTAKWEGVTA